MLEAETRNKPRYVTERRKSAAHPPLLLRNDIYFFFQINRPANRMKAARFGSGSQTLGKRVINEAQMYRSRTKQQRQSRAPPGEGRSLDAQE